MARFLPSGLSAPRNESQGNEWIHRKIRGQGFLPDPITYSSIASNVMIAVTGKDMAIFSFPHCTLSLIIGNASESASGPTSWFKARAFVSRRAWR